MSDIETTNTLTVNDEPEQVEDFFATNKKTTIDYREKMAQAVGLTGVISKITHMAFGDKGEVDTDGNPVPPTDNGDLNNILLTKEIKSVTYPVPTTVCFEAEILQGDLTASINEVALIDEAGVTAAKMRLLTSKGTDAESGLNFKWYMEF